MTARLPSLNGLRAFEAAARHLSFTLAAAELNVTQTAISHQIRRLEEELGIRLFVRQNRGTNSRSLVYLRVVLSAFAPAQAGKRAFAGDSAASVIAAILEREPEPLAAAPPLERVVRRALAKDPDRLTRFHREARALLTPGSSSRRRARWKLRVLPRILTRH